jgi:hypothetical protein
MTADTALAASADFMAAAERTTHLLSLADGTVEILTILHALQEGADDESELVARLQKVETFLSEKLEACSVVVRDLESLAAYRKLEADRLRDQAKRLEAAADRLRLRIRDHMIAVGDDRVVTPRHTISLRMNPPRVDVLEEQLVPREFKKTVITETVDKRAILDAFKTNGEIPEGVNVVREWRAQIS